jgi:hypothetical protein
MRPISLSPIAIWNRLRVPLVIAGALAVMVAIARWGGVAQPGPLFAAGVALLSGLVLAFGLLAWWLYLSQLRTQAVAAPPRSTAARQVLGMLSLISGALFLIGSFWDEVWHRTYGSFGDDFLWPPHMLIYGSLALVALFAGGGLLLMMIGGGDLRQHFRAEPHVGLLALVSAFLVASIPSDLLWHSIYGADLTAWGLPHLMLASGVTLVLLATVALQLSLIPATPWRGLRGLAAAELPALLGCAGATTMLLQFGTADWEGLTAVGDIGINSPIFWQRPEWLYPTVIAAIALFTGNLAIHALRRAGAATAVALVTLAFRLVLLVGADAMRPGVGMGFVPQLAIVPPLLLLDLWYFAQIRSTSSLNSQFSFLHIAVGNLLAGTLFLIAGLPLIARALIYPHINLETLPGMIGWSLAAALAFGWAGARLGAWLGALDRPAKTPRASAWAGRVAAAALIAAGLFTAFFLLTARPPIAA